MTCRLTSSKLAGRGLPAAVLTLMMLAFAVGLRATPDGEQAKYLSPGEMAISPDGSRLYVVCERSNQLLVVNVRSADRKSSDANSGDAKSGAVVKRIDVGRAPRGAALASKGDRIYVTNSWDDTVSVMTRKLCKSCRLYLRAPSPPAWSSIVKDEHSTPPTG